MLSLRSPYFYTAMALLSLFVFHSSPAVEASTASASATSTAATVPTTDETLRWTGAWKFEESWFGSQHPWLPGFLKRQALQSTLLLHDEFYHQVDGNGRALKAPRKLQVVATEHPHKTELERIEHGGRKVSFAMERRPDGFVYYIEKGLGEYRVIPSPEGETHLAELHEQSQRQQQTAVEL